MAFIQYLARIHFDPGVRRLIGQEAARAGMRRPLVISDHGLERAGVLATALEFCPDIAGSPRFLELHSHPDTAAVEAALQAYHDHDCDGLVAIGGGSVIDCAKAVALLASHDGPLDEYVVGRGRPITAAIAPVVAVPTTAGTGSEVGRAMGITLASGDKGVFIDVNLVPKAAICDPELTLGLPRWITAGAGIDALSHALEAYLAPPYNPPADAVALDAIARLARWLPIAAREPLNLPARSETMMGATEAAMTTWKGLGAAHALSMPLDAFGLHHGTIIGVLLPYATRAVLKETPRAKIDALAGALNCQPDAVSARLADLSQAIGLPAGLAAMGIPQDALADCATAATLTSFNANLAKPLTADDYLQVAHAAYNPAGAAVNV